MAGGSSTQAQGAWSPSEPRSPVRLTQVGTRGKQGVKLWGQGHSGTGGGGREETHTEVTSASVLGRTGGDLMSSCQRGPLLVPRSPALPLRF